MQHSVILPTLNEGSNPKFASILENLKRSGLEAVVVDGGSKDDTAELVQSFALPFISAPGTNRAQRFNLGLESCNGKVVLLHHPRSVLRQDALQQFAALQHETWGGFTHEFDRKHPVLGFTSFYSNHVRFPRGIIYLDHCIFAPKAWLTNIGGVPPLDIFEDTALSVALRKKGRPLRLNARAQTSAIRFERNGIYYQSLLNQIMKIGYYLNWSKAKMNGIYEASLHLNKQDQKDHPL